MLHTPLSAIPDYLVPYRSRIRSKQFDYDQAGIHFFLDDYRFETVWTRPKRALEYLKKYHVLLTPDFSLYADWPLAMQMWNVYRSRWLGRWWQELGFQVIPTVSWSTSESYDFCFTGLPMHSIVTVSTVGVDLNDAMEYENWLSGYRAMLDHVQPSVILAYGQISESTDSTHQIITYPTYWSEDR